MCMMPIAGKVKTEQHWEEKLSHKNHHNTNWGISGHVVPWPRWHTNDLHLWSHHILANVPSMHMLLSLVTWHNRSIGSETLSLSTCRKSLYICSLPRLIFCRRYPPCLFLILVPQTGDLWLVRRKKNPWVSLSPLLNRSTFFQLRKLCVDQKTPKTSLLDLHVEHMLREALIMESYFFFYNKANQWRI